MHQEREKNMKDSEYIKELESRLNHAAEPHRAMQTTLANLTTEYIESKKNFERRDEILRDNFAMAALTGLLANSYSDGFSQPICTASKDQFAVWAYQQADAMMAERKSS